MSIQQLLLLPTQASLVQRLHHAAVYSQQVTVVYGEQGSGKSTITTALASEFEDYNSALVICPKYADDAEIRRKILVQLINVPVVDDQIPLLDTIIRVKSELQKPLHIIIDDAHLLSNEIWAECILLSQIQCAGKNVAVTFSVDTPFWPTLMAQLTSEMKQWLLPVYIEPLPLSERESLYQALLLRSEATPFISLDVVRDRLAAQDGTPTEVLQQLAIAIESPVVEKKSWRKLQAFAAALILVLGAVTTWFYWPLNHSWSAPTHANATSAVNEHLTVAQTLARQQASQFIALYGQQYVQQTSPVTKAMNTTSANVHLSNAVAISMSNDLLSPSHLHTLKQIEKQQKGQINQQATASIDDALVFESDIVTANEKGEVKALVSTDEPLLENQLAESANSSIELFSSVNTVQQTTAIETQSIEQIAEFAEADEQAFSGYTLQLANVTQQASLESLLVKFANESLLVVTRHKQRYVLFVGQFENSDDARNQAKQFQSQYGIALPWVRKWNDLSEYQILESSAN